MSKPAIYHVDYEREKSPPKIVLSSKVGAIISDIDDTAEDVTKAKQSPKIIKNVGTTIPDIDAGEVTRTKGAASPLHKRSLPENIESLSQDQKVTNDWGVTETMFNEVKRKPLNKIVNKDRKMTPIRRVFIAILIAAFTFSVVNSLLKTLEEPTTFEETEILNKATFPSLTTCVRDLRFDNVTDFEELTLVLHEFFYERMYAKIEIHSKDEKR